MRRRHEEESESVHESQLSNHGQPHTQERLNSLSRYRATWFNFDSMVKKTEDYVPTTSQFIRIPGWKWFQVTTPGDGKPPIGPPSQTHFDENLLAELFSWHHASHSVPEKAAKKAWAGSVQSKKHIDSGSFNSMRWSRPLLQGGNTCKMEARIAANKPYESSFLQDPLRTKRSHTRYDRILAPPRGVYPIFEKSTPEGNRWKRLYTCASFIFQKVEGEFIGKCTRTIPMESQVATYRQLKIGILTWARLPGGRCSPQISIRPYGV